MSMMATDAVVDNARGCRNASDVRRGSCRPADGPLGEDAAAVEDVAAAVADVVAMVATVALVVMVKGEAIACSETWKLDDERPAGEKTIEGTNVAKFRHLMPFGD